MKKRGKTTKIMHLLEKETKEETEGKGEEGGAEERRGRKILSLCPTPSSFSSRDCLWVFLSSLIFTLCKTFFPHLFFQVSTDDEAFPSLELISPTASPSPPPLSSPSFSSSDFSSSDLSDDPLEEEGEGEDGEGIKRKGGWEVAGGCPYRAAIKKFHVMHDRSHILTMDALGFSTNIQISIR